MGFTIYLNGDLYVEKRKLVKYYFLELKGAYDAC